MNRLRCTHDRDALRMLGRLFNVGIPHERDALVREPAIFDAGGALTSVTMALVAGNNFF